MSSLDREAFLNAGEACALLGIKPATLYAYVSRGVLPSYREGMRRRRLYRRADVERLLTLRPAAEPAAPESNAASAAEPSPGGAVPRAEDWIPFAN